MATTLESLENDISSDIQAFENDISVFINEIKAAAQAQAFTIVPEDGLGNTILIRTGSSGDSFFNALQTKPVKPINLAFEKPLDPGIAPSNFVLSDVVTTNIPTFADNPPELSFPEVPVVALPSAPVAPSINAPAVPTAPTVSLPTSPVLSAVSLPSAPTLTLPTFTESFPETPDLLLQTDSFSFVDEEFSNVLNTNIQALLVSDLANGGFGIVTADEEAAYSRILDREVRASQQREREIQSRYASKGFDLPQGALLEMHIQSATETMERISAANREVGINRAELKRRAREFAIQQGISIVTVMVRDHGFQQERRLNAARFAAEFTVAVLDAKISSHNLKLKAYQAYSEAYATQIRALLAQIEIYKTQVDAARVEQQINESVVNVYEAQVRAANTLINLYTNELQAVRTQVEIEGLKLDQYRTSTQAFVSQIQARAEELRLFEAQIRAESVKQDVYQSQVQSFATRVNAAKTEADVQLAKLTADVRSAELQLLGYRTNVSKYEADLQAEARRIAAELDTYNADIGAYNAVLSGWEGLSRVDIASAEAYNREIQAEELLEVEKLRLKINEVVERTKIKLSASEAGAAIYRDTLSALNTSRNVLISKEEA